MKSLLHPTLFGLTIGLIAISASSPDFGMAIPNIYAEMSSASNGSEIRIAWNPNELTIVDTMNFPLEINFTSSHILQNATLVESDELKGVIEIVSPQLSLVNASQLQFPEISMLIGPETTGGWHNGTLALSVNGVTLPDKLSINVQVPKLNKTVMPGPKGISIYSIVVPSYSPFFNDTVNLFTWFVLDNGTKFLNPYMSAYDAFINSTAHDEAISKISISTDKSNYDIGDEIVITGMIRDYNASKAVEGSKASLAIYRVDPFISAYETFVSINEDGSFTIRVPVEGQLAQSGKYDVYYGDLDAYFTVGGAATSDNQDSNGYNARVVTVDGNQYLIRYMITGNISIENMTVDKDSKSMIVLLDPNHGNGTISLQLRREVIDAQDINGADLDYILSVDGTSQNFTEFEKSDTTRAITIDVTSDAREIVISGTRIVPEFPAFISIVAVGAVLGTMVSIQRLRDLH